MIPILNISCLSGERRYSIGWTEEERLVSTPDHPGGFGTKLFDHLQQ